MLTLLSGACGAYSTDPGYSYYGSPYGGGVVAFGDGRRDDWHHGYHDWDDHHGSHHESDDHHDWQRRS
jgi:hypothetical protein